MALFHRIVKFSSRQFAVEPGEDDAVNPGIFGRALAHWIAEELKGRGVPAGDPLPEDWGWRVPAADSPIMLWVGCSSADATASTWVIQVVGEWPPLTFFKRFARRKAIAELEESLVGHVNSLVVSIADARDIAWETVRTTVERRA